MGAIEAVGDSDRQPPSRYSWNDGIPRADVEPWKEVESKFEAIFLVRALRENSYICIGIMLPISGQDMGSYTQAEPCEHPRGMIL